MPPHSRTLEIENMKQKNRKFENLAPIKMLKNHSYIYSMISGLSLAIIFFFIILFKVINLFDENLKLIVFDTPNYRKFIILLVLSCISTICAIIFYKSIRVEKNWAMKFGYWFYVVVLSDFTLKFTFAMFL